MGISTFLYIAGFDLINIYYDFLGLCSWRIFVCLCVPLCVSVYVCVCVSCNVSIPFLYLITLLSCNKLLRTPSSSVFWKYVYILQWCYLLLKSLIEFFQWNHSCLKIYLGKRFLIKILFLTVKNAVWIFISSSFCFGKANYFIIVST